MYLQGCGKLDGSSDVSWPRKFESPWKSAHRNNKNLFLFFFLISENHSISLVVTESFEENIFKVPENCVLSTWFLFYSPSWVVHGWRCKFMLAIQSWWFHFHMTICCFLNEKKKRAFLTEKVGFMALFGSWEESTYPSSIFETHMLRNHGYLFILLLFVSHSTDVAAKF